jgi:hypothetical protein
MPTTVTNTIGAGGTYSTVQAWEDACPANLVTADQIWRGECKNQEFSVASGVVTIAGMTVDATRYVELTTEAGASFRDHASKLANALRYDSANGAALTSANAYVRTVNAQVSHTRISNLQLKHTNTSSGCVFGETSGGGTNGRLDNCILENFSSLEVVRSQAGQWDMTNCLLINRKSSGDSAVLMQGTPSKTFRGCTFVRPSNLTAAAAAIDTNYNTTTVQNCAVFGFTSFKAGTSTFAGDDNATDLASVGFGSGHQTNLAFASQFEQSSDSGGSHDFRAKSGGGLIDNGTTDSAYGADIVGTSRPQGSAYDIGCWELGAAGGNYSDSVTLAGLTLAGAPGLALAVSGALAAPPGLYLAASAGLQVVLDWVDQVAAASLRLALAGGVALAGAAAVLGRVVGFMANPNRLLGR